MKPGKFKVVQYTINQNRVVKVIKCKNHNIALATYKQMIKHADENTYYIAIEEDNDK